MIEERDIILTGLAGDIEAKICVDPGQRVTDLAVICHPHPLHGGTMGNKVVTTLAKTYWQLDIPTLRFNFRGVGKSAGEFANGEGETDDLLVILEWINQQAIASRIWLAGFSFGACVALRAATRIPAYCLVTVAPPVMRYRCAEEVRCPWVLVQGGKDDIVPALEVEAWAKTLVVPPQWLLMPTADHFFHGQLIELRQRLTELLIPLL
jgi:uncharacterized protein